MRKPGRSRVDDSPHRKLGLSSDAKVILALLKKQPQKRDELLKSAYISLQTWYRVFPALERFKILKETERGYALSTYVDREEDVVKAIKRWKEVAFCYPDPMEIADATGIPPLDAEALARKTVKKTGWYMPNQAVRESATEKLGEVLGWLARKRDGKLENFDYKRYPNDIEIVKAAELGLKEHLDMLPNFDEDGNVASWSSNALRYLRKDYKLKDREQPVVEVLPQ